MGTASESFVRVGQPWEPQVGEARKAPARASPQLPPVFFVMASAQPQAKTEPTNEAVAAISALTEALKSGQLPGDKLANWIHQNMAHLDRLVDEGKLTQGQILAVRDQCRLLSSLESSSVADTRCLPSTQLKEFVDKYKTPNLDTSNEAGPFRG